MEKMPGACEALGGFSADELTLQMNDCLEKVHMLELKMCSNLSFDQG